MLLTRVQKGWRGVWVPAGRERPEGRWLVETSKHHIPDSQRGSFLISSLTLATWDGAGPTPAPPSGTQRGGQEVTTQGPLAAQTPRDWSVPASGSQRLGRGRWLALCLPMRREAALCEAPAEALSPEGRSLPGCYFSLLRQLQNPKESASWPKPPRFFRKRI